MWRVVEDLGEHIVRDEWGFKTKVRLMEAKEVNDLLESGLKSDDDGELIDSGSGGKAVLEAGTDLPEGS